MGNSFRDSGGSAKAAINSDVVVSDESLVDLARTLPEKSLDKLQVPTMDKIAEKINYIQSSSDFGDWLKSFMDKIKDSPEIFSQTPESMNWLRDISRFAVSNYPGYFSSLNTPAPDSPQSWQLLAHVIYSTFPSGD